MKKELLKILEDFIPLSEKGIFKTKGSLLPLEEENYTNIDDNNLPNEMKFHETKQKKIIETIGVIAMISMIVMVILNESKKENPNEDLTIITIVFGVFMLGLAATMLEKWFGEDSKRELAISSEGLKLNQWKKIKWNEIEEVTLKSFPSGDSKNYYLIIIDREKIIHDFNITGFKGRANFGFINPDYLELRNILWKYKNKYSRTTIDDNGITPPL